MEIALMRHYPVDFHFEPWSDSAAFDRDMDTYDTAPIKIPKIKIKLSDWDICYCSTLSRATKTAERIMAGKKIVRTDLLIEVPLKSAIRTRFKLPLAFWAFAARIQWWFNTGSQPESRKITTRRAIDFYTRFCRTNEDHFRILVVTHGFFMVCLRRLLKKKGFSGPWFLKPANGEIYVFSDTGKKNQVLVK
jgi:broad specificity phosphatase PhoE